MGPTHPLELGAALWPEVRHYRKQRQMVDGVRRYRETFVGAGNELGKDFEAAFIALTFFLAPRLYMPEVPESEGLRVRVVSTSVADHHLRVLWGEVDRFIRTSRVPLTRDKGGPLVYLHREIRRVGPDGQVDKESYFVGQVSEHGEGMAGHHAPYSLAIVDEASGVSEQVYQQMLGWAKRMLIIGNTNPCPRGHFFRKGVEGGDLVIKEVKPCIMSTGWSATSGS